MTPLLELRNGRIGVGERLFCQALQWSILPGQCWAVLGPNGAGKTTLLHTLAGLTPLQAGQVWLDNQPLTALSRRVVARSLGILFQEYAYHFPLTVLETVLAGRHPHIPFWSFESDRDRALSLEAMVETGLVGMEERLVSSLSGGERRRMEAAALLAQAPKIFLLDEPTNHLDLNRQIVLLDLFTRKVRQQNGAMVMVLHDLNLAARFCDHFLFLFGTGETLHGTREEMLQESLLHRLFSHPMYPIAHGGGRIWVPG
ncbi:MAG: ABC transporter ATP-binding protein [Magnetococcales bacterium]|nr:ABC transporter ATP-binding protein [Magnetococcales bacterium]